MKDSSVHEDPNLLKVGIPRGDITAAFGTPNQITYQGGQEQDVYEFNPDGAKFVKPKTYARNIAAGVFTGGIATVVHQARIHHTEQQLTGITSTTDLMGSCSPFKRNRVAMPAATATHENNLWQSLTSYGGVWPQRDPKSAPHRLKVFAMSSGLQRGATN